jgi:hypothetical protein
MDIWKKLKKCYLPGNNCKGSTLMFTVIQWWKTKSWYENQKWVYEDVLCLWIVNQNTMEINRKPIGEIKAQEEFENWEAEIQINWN